MRAGVGYAKTETVKPDARVIAALTLSFPAFRKAPHSKPLGDSPRLRASPFFRFPLSAQTRGWAMKACEFINSGPPALLNNPQCCMRVVGISFHTYAMEVDYG